MPLKDRLQPQAEDVVGRNGAATGETRLPLRRPPHQTVIEPSRGWVHLGLREVWRYRELLFFLVWRDVKVRYKQTILGIVWVVMQPVMTMLIFTFVFNRLANIRSGSSVPYPLFAYAGLLPWQLFAGGLTGASTSLVGNAGLLTKVYFPRLVIPFASVISGLVDFAIAFLVLIGLMAYYEQPVHLTVLALPLFIALAVATALAIGLWLSMLNVRFRDIQYTIPFLTQIWLFLTPVAYSTGLIPPKWRWLIGINPLTSVVDGFRWALLGNKAPWGTTFYISLAMVFVILVGGIAFFKRTEKTVADVI
jgi:lipopolysaccharide transport system permease protein